jgi:dihydrofolate reductase
MALSLIVAVAENNVIGQSGGGIPWHLPAELAHFKAVTMGHPIIMGRATHETIGRPLPGRTNIIVTRDQSYRVEGGVVAHSLDEAIRLAQADDDAEQFIIGGSQIYAQALDKAASLYLTTVHSRPNGDITFYYHPSQWREVSRQRHAADNRNQFAYTFTKLVRKN